MDVDDHEQEISGDEHPTHPVHVREGQRSLGDDDHQSDHADRLQLSLGQVHRRLRERLGQALREQEGGDQRDHVVDEDEAAAEHDDVAQILASQDRRRAEQRNIDSTLITAWPVPQTVAALAIAIATRRRERWLVAV